jgi:glycerophosphoryl diester phosphodiesterase
VGYDPSHDEKSREIMGRIAVRESLFCALLLSMSCSKQHPIEIHGHRGIRGHMPENTMSGMLYAQQLGVPTLEMDVVISADGEVLLSHEPWLNPIICLDPDGNHILQDSGKFWNLYKMPYEDIAKCDCGSLKHPDFPEQKRRPTKKPLLREILTTLEAVTRERFLAPLHYNIEIKSNPETDDLFHPKPEEYVETVLRVVYDAGVANRTIIQSFDWRILLETKILAPDIQTSFLVERPSEGFVLDYKALGFNPNIYSPYYKTVTEEMVSHCNAAGMKLIPWTVNQPEDMRRLIKLGVDGIITDYPDRLFLVLGLATSY